MLARMRDKLSLHALGPALHADVRAAVLTEYVIIVGSVGLLAMAALVAIGPQLIGAYDHARNVLAVPFP